MAETLCSLEFASRAMQIEVDARVNRMIQLDREAAIGAPVTTHQVDHCAMSVQEDELASARQAGAEAIARADAAQAETATMNEALLQATMKAEHAEARALTAEQDAKEWKERYNAASAEMASSKATIELAESRAQTAEQVANEWKNRCGEAMQKIESLEAKLSGASREMQLRRTQLCTTAAELETLKAEQAQIDMHKAVAAEASHAAELAAARASQLEAESQQAVAMAKAQAAEAKAEQARAKREAQQLAFEREHVRSLRDSWSNECEDEEQRLAKMAQSLDEQRNDVMQRANFVEGLEMEKKELAKKKRQLEEERQELHLDKRRLRNAVMGSGPPPLQSKGSPGKPRSLSKLLSVDRAEHAKTRSSLRSSSETQLHKSSSGATLVFTEGVQAHSHSSARVRTPSRPRC